MWWRNITEKWKKILMIMSEHNNFVSGAAEFVKHHNSPKQRTKMFQPEISSRTFHMMGKIISDTFLVPFHDLSLVLAVSLDAFLFSNFSCICPLLCPKACSLVRSDYCRILVIRFIEGSNLIWYCWYGVSTSCQAILSGCHINCCVSL